MGDYAVSFVLATLIEKTFPKQYAERTEETREEEREKKKAIVMETPRITTPSPEDPICCADFGWDSGAFFANCLGSGCFVMD